MTANKARIVIADDSIVVRTLLRRQLEEHGHDVFEAVDGEDALRVCREVGPDLLLLDVEMPKLDGHGVLRVLRDDSELSDVPVVFLTARTTTEDVVEGLRLGAHDYLRKPFEPSELLARVHAAVPNKALQDELRLRNAELELASRTDALTGLHNRRHLEEQLQRLAATGDPLSVLLPGTGPAEAAAMGERTRLAIAAAPVPLAEGPLTVTTSVGVATGANDGWEWLVRRADTGLYAAKESGRDRVAAGPPPEPAAGSRTFTPEGQDAARYR